MTTLYPLVFQPSLKDYIWGGRHLESLYQRALPPGIIAESWEISGHPDGLTTVAQGPLAGHTLPKLLAQFGADLVGTQAKWALDRHTFPLLVKLLDANRPLSVQVHPGDEAAKQESDTALGKTEMWYILHTTRPDAKIIFGLKQNTTAAKFRQAIENQSLSQHLHYLPVKAGDAILVEAGSIHAILEGVVLTEIQQSSNITYRVYDWGRLGADGQPRPLHVEKALQVINFTQTEPGPYAKQTLGPHRTEISRCDYFVVEEVSLKTGQVFKGQTDGSTLEIWGTVQGSARLQSRETALSLPTIRFCLIPATQGPFSLTAEADSTLLRVYLP